MNTTKILNEILSLPITEKMTGLLVRPDGSYKLIKEYSWNEVKKYIPSPVGYYGVSKRVMVYCIDTFLYHPEIPDNPIALHIMKLLDREEKIMRGNILFFDRYDEDKSEEFYTERDTKHIVFLLKNKGIDPDEIDIFSILDATNLPDDF